MIINKTKEYSIVRSDRKTLVVAVNKGGDLVVKVPMKMPEQKITEFLNKNAVRISNLKMRYRHKVFLTEGHLKKEFKAFKAVALLQSRFDYVAEIAKEHGLLSSAPVTFKILKSRWGSCSSDGRICLNIFLGLLPVHLIDVVIMHEFCHRKEMNHSPRFYKILRQLCPQYQSYDAELRQYVIARE